MANFVENHLSLSGNAEQIADIEAVFARAIEQEVSIGLSDDGAADVDGMVQVDWATGVEIEDTEAARANLLVDSNNLVRDGNRLSVTFSTRWSEPLFAAACLARRFPGVEGMIEYAEHATKWCGTLHIKADGTVEDWPADYDEMYGDEDSEGDED